MKRLLFVLAALCPYLISYGQTYIYEDLTNDTLQTVEEVLEHVDLSLVSSGLLLDKAFPYADPTLHDGLHLDTDNLIDFDTFSFLYATLYGASVSADAVPPHPSAYTDASDAYDDGGPLGLALARFDYNRFRSDAIVANLLDTLDSRIYDVPGRSELPYTDHQTFFAAPVSSYATGPDVRFRFDPTLVLTNTPTTATALSVDFGDGNGLVALSPGDVHEVTYTNPGEVILLITATYSDGAVLQSHATLTVRADPLGRTYSDSPNFTEEFTSNGDKLRIEVITACGDNSIRKPFFYVMGFNPDGDNQKDFGEMLTFLRKTYNATGNDNQTVLDLLHLQGYDIIYCDWEVTENNLYDHIATLRQAIDWVNAEKATTGSQEENIIFGRSMGGLISRYALLEMESEGLDHQTKKLITMDTGHRGNNTPPALQAMAYDLAYTKVYGSVALAVIVKKMRKGPRLLNGAATRQLTIHHLANSPDFNEYDWGGFDGVDRHEEFFSSLSTLGEPGNFEMVCMSNGSITGQPNPILDPGDKMIFANIIPQNNWVAYFTGIVFNLKGYALRNQGAGSDPYTIYRKFAIVPILGIAALDSYTRVRVNDLLPLDTAPGGQDPIAEEIPGFIKRYTGKAFYTVCPTFSALNLDVSYLNQAVPPTGIVPPAISRWIGSSTSSYSTDYQINMHNQKHVSFNENLARFFLKEVTAGVGPRTLGGLGNPRVLLEDYNFGLILEGETGLHTPDALIRPHTIPNNRTLHINRDLPLGNVDNPDNPAAATGVENYEFFLRNGVDCNGPTGPAHLTVAQGGQLLVGDWAAGNTATVIVEDYASISVDGYMELDRFSTLLVKAHTTLRIAGRVRLNADARIIVEPGGILTVQPGGELDLGSRARVEVASNAFLWHRSAGIIKAGVDAEVIIEEGARYQLFEGSEVRLWSGQNPYGTACIRLFGIVHWNGEPHFSGNGHFSFEQGAQLFIPFPDDPNGPREFRLRGQRPDFRFLTVKSLQVPKGVDVHLSRGIIQSSGLYTFGGYIEFENTHWHGSTGLDAEAPQRVIARRSTFTGMTGALSVREATQPTVGTTVRECTFTRCQTGLYVENNRYNVEVIESTFDGGATTEATGLEAIWGVNARKIHVTDTDIFGYVRSMVDDQTGAVEHAAVTLDGVRDLELIGDSLNRLRAANLILLRVKKPRLIYG